MAKSRFFTYALLILCLGAAIASPGILRADLGDNNPTDVAGDFNGNVTTGCSYD